MNDLPSGTVAFLFTDIEGSTQLAREHPEQCEALFERHNTLLHSAIKEHKGFVFRIVGDSFSAAFHTADDALNAALQAQRNFHNEAWSPAPVKVRMGIHTGAAQVKNDSSGTTYDGYATLALSQRVMSAGHGGQILLSQTAHDLVKDTLRDGTELRDMGERKLKDILNLERLYQVTAPDLPSEFPALKTIETARHNLPSQLTSFIGRERELTETTKLISTARLLTLIGPGGTGKTRLSLQLGEDQLANFKDGVWVVELAPIVESPNIVPAIASVFELREAQNIPLTEILLDYLRAKQLLLILDNCEHLVEASAQIAEELLQACAGVKVIVSSREALGIEGETIFRVPSLVNDEATRLFVERAVKAEPRFKLTDSNASFVGQICSRLDGIPLAIELAAARVKLFTPEQIAARLDDRFKLLTGGSRTALPRQQTLRALIDWSYTSLNETEQRALRRLAVFSGGWTFEAAESVVGENEAMESLASLVNKSLVNVEEQDGESRYRFLETIRQYAMEKLLESGEGIDARDRQLEYMLRIAEQAEQKMFGSESGEWLDQMEAEHDNLRAALEWSASNHIEKAMRLALGIGGFWTSRDYNSEAREWCKIILERSESLTGAGASRAKLFALQGWTAITTGNHKEGRAAARAGLEPARIADDKQCIVRLLMILGLSSLFIGDFSTSLAAIEESITLARQMGYKGELAMSLTARAQASFYANKDIESIEKNMEEAFALAREAGFTWVSSMLAYGAGRMAGYLGDIETARARMNEGMELSKQMGNKRMMYSSRSELAHILREHGILDEAYEFYKEVIPGWRDLGHRAAIAHELECMAYILIKRETPERAATLFGAAEALREAIDTEMTSLERVEYDREVTALRAGMDDSDFNRLWSQGRALTMDEAIQLALS